MKLKREVLITVLLAMFLSSSVLCGNANARETVGSLGEYLNFTISAPEEAKMGESVVVNMTFTDAYDFVDVSPRDYFISIEKLAVSFDGANITFSKAWRNVKLRSWESVNDSITLTPSTQGLIGGVLSAEYNYTYEGSSTVGHSFGAFYLGITNVRTSTYDELLNSNNLLYALLYILVLTTIVLIATTIYFARRGPKLERKYWAR